MSGRGRSDSCVLRKRKRPASRQPDVVVYVVTDECTERWALFNLTIEQKDAIQRADGLLPQERACEVARFVIGDISAEEMKDTDGLPQSIPKENIEKGWTPDMHPGGSDAPTVNYMIFTTD